MSFRAFRGGRFLCPRYRLQPGKNRLAETWRIFAIGGRDEQTGLLLPHVKLT